jgi:hypothetical protein
VPFTKIADPAIAAFLTGALDEICRQAGLEPGSPECDDAASLIMRLYWSGHRSPEKFKAALFANFETAERGIGRESGVLTDG